MLISNITPQLKVGGGGEGRTTTMTALFSHNGGFYGRRIRREYREPPNAKCNKKIGFAARNVHYWHWPDRMGWEKWRCLDKTLFFRPIQLVSFSQLIINHSHCVTDRCTLATTPTLTPFPLFNDFFLVEKESYTSITSFLLINST